MPGSMGLYISIIWYHTARSANAALKYPSFKSFLTPSTRCEYVSFSRALQRYGVVTMGVVVGARVDGGSPSVVTSVVVYGAVTFPSVALVVALVVLFSVIGCVVTIVVVWSVVVGIGVVVGGLVVVAL